MSTLNRPVFSKNIVGLFRLSLVNHICVTKQSLPQILIWNLEIGEPVKMIDCHTDVILSMSFNTDGSLLATSCKDKKLRVIEPRSGAVLQVSAAGPGSARAPLSL